MATPFSFKSSRQQCRRWMCLKPFTEKIQTKAGTMGRYHKKLSITYGKRYNLKGTNYKTFLNT